jgi:hydrogenase maturation protein HypF
VTVRAVIRVDGIVQGVGFRPFVHRVATELGLAGTVGNDGQGVVIEAQGDPGAVAALVTTLREHPPPLAVVERVTTRDIPCARDAGFTIAPSRRSGTAEALVSPDVATCADCLAELADPHDRRYGYPFVNCVNCGPRFTIVTGVPYDRPLTTMAGFPMCANCRREYDDPADRRFHAQPVCCPACGPRLMLRGRDGELLDDERPLAAAAQLLRGGAVVAVKGVGGYHIAVLASDERAVATLRGRKHREAKPFAVLCRNLAAARALAEVDDVAAALLASPAAPIVLLPRRAGAAVAPSVAPGNRKLGILLPYTALHHLLARAVGEPIVLTSGNVSDEPIAFDDDDALDRLAAIADAFLVHDRPIHVRADDSVVRIERGHAVPVRRSRGYAPAPLRLPIAAPLPILACGAELKSTFTLVKGERAFVSHHIGDLENAETLRSFVDGIAHYRRLFDVTPAVVAYDRHPDYLSTKYALDIDGVEHVAVQHHHAHIASCLADNGETGPVIGVAYDGLGYGDDGTLWGGELLVADLVRSTRVGHLGTTRMPGGARATREPWRMAAAWILSAYGDEPPPALAVAHRHADRWADVSALAARGVAAPETSSVGRLFDAVAALCGVRDVVTYEGQAAIELEQVASLGPGTTAYPMPVLDGEPLVLDGAATVRAVVADLRAGAGAPVVAARFHAGLAAATAVACAAIGDRTGLDTVALSGGVFANEVLTTALVELLTAAGFRVLTHRHVPPGDGGISFGQAAVAAARLTSSGSSSSAEYRAATAR